MPLRDLLSRWRKDAQLWFWGLEGVPDPHTNPVLRQASLSLPREPSGLVMAGSAKLSKEED